MIKQIIGSIITDSLLEEYRENLDPLYHDQYVPRRRVMQNNIVRKILSVVPISSTVSDGSFFQLIVVAGPIGSGKSNLVQALKQTTDDFFLHIDINAIRYELPECRKYATECPHLMADLTQKESGAICELLIHAALRLHIPLILESTLNDFSWNRKFFQALKSKFIGMQIQLIHITASEETLIRRIERRNQEAGKKRVVLNHVVSDSYQQLNSLDKFKAAFSDICINIIGIDNTADYNCDDFTSFEPKIIFPWHLNWIRIRHLLKIQSASAIMNQRQESRWFDIQHMSTDTVSDEYVTAKHGLPETKLTSESSTNYYDSLYSVSKDTSSFDVSHSSNDSYETALQHSIPLSISSNEILSSKKQEETNCDTVRSSSVPSWMIERLRLYHKSRNAKDCGHPSTHNTCFLCSVDKLPICYQSLHTSPATFYSNSAETQTSNQTQSSFRYHTYPSIR